MSNEPKDTSKKTDSTQRSGPISPYISPEDDRDSPTESGTSCRIESGTSCGIEPTEPWGRKKWGEDT